MKRLLTLYAALAYAFLHLPLVVLAVFSFNSSKFTLWRGFTLNWYRAAFSDRQLMEAAGNSLLIAAVSTACATCLGTLAAYAIWKRPAPLFTHVLFLSLITPEIVTGISLLVFFQWSSRFLGMRTGMHTVVLAHVTFSIVYVVIVVLTRLRTLDRGLEEAAQDLGATDWHAFRLVTLPLLWPGIIAAGLLAFTMSFDDYVITSMVAGIDSETLPMAIYAMARRGGSPVVNAVSTLMAAALAILIVVSERLRAA